MIEKCPCGSGILYTNCCAPYLEGQKYAPSAEALMRSRYTAYTQNNMDYIERTWDSSTCPTHLRDSQAQAPIQWLNLRIVDRVAGLARDDTGIVEFIATYRAGAKQYSLHERSEFRQVNGQWLYVTGETMTKPTAKQQPAKIGRNELCHCGSGKKYKKCCWSC